MKKDILFKLIQFFRICLPTTAGISPYGCDGADCQGLKCARVVV